MRHRELKRRDVMSEMSYRDYIYMANNDINVLSVTATGLDSWVAVIEYALLRPADKKKIWPKMAVEVDTGNVNGPGLVVDAIAREAIRAVRHIRDCIEAAADEQATLDLLSSALKGR